MKSNDIYREMIIDFVEGDLDPAEESELLSAISYDTQLKDDLRNCIKLKSNSASVNMIIPPPALTNSLFESIGLESPVPNIEKPKRSIFAKLNFTKTLPAFILGALLMLVAVKFVTVDSNNYKIDNKANYPISYNNSSDKSQALADNNKPGINNQKKSNNQLINNRYSSIVSNEAEVKPENNSLDNSSKKLNTFYLSQSKEVPYMQFIKIVPINNSPVLVNDMDLVSTQREKKKFSIGVMNSRYLARIEENIHPTHYSFLNNLGITAKYALNQSFNIGLDLRQETFYQKYWGANSAGLLVQYEQQPNFTTICALLEYSPMMMYDINPLAQFEFGINQRGIVSRAMIGLKYELFDNFYLNLNYEYSRMDYKYSNRSFNSDKYGFVYGLSIGL